MKLNSIVLAVFLFGVAFAYVSLSAVMAEEPMQDKANLIQIIEDYVVANQGWEKGSFYIKANPFAGEGGFSVIKNNSPMTLGGNQNSFLIKVDLKTHKIIGAFAYQ